MHLRVDKLSKSPLKCFAWLPWKEMEESLSRNWIWINPEYLQKPSTVGHNDYREGESIANQVPIGAMTEYWWFSPEEKNFLLAFEVSWPSARVLVLQPPPWCSQWRSCQNEPEWPRNKREAGAPLPTVECPSSVSFSPHSVY